MKILAIDPGPEHSAFVIWDGVEVLGMNPKEKNGRVIELISDQAGFFLPEVDAVAVEHLQCFGMPVGGSVFETAYWIGEMRGCLNRVYPKIASGGYRSVKFIRIYRSDVKMHLCRSMRAKDSNIRAALIDRFGAPGTKHNPGVTHGLRKDAWSAFAIAVTAWDRSNGK